MEYYDLRHEGEDIDALLDKADAGELVEQKDLSKVATSGDYNDLENKPNIPAEVTEQKVRGWGFTKNTGTVTGVKINGSTKNPSNGVVDLGTVITEHQDIAGIEGDVTVNKLAQRLSTPSEDNTNPLATTKDLESKTDIVASQIFLEFYTDFDNFQIFSHKSGYEEHNREVCQRLIENCFTDKTPNNEVFFVTINGLRDGVPYMETAILESQAEEIVRASFVKGINPAQSGSIAATIDILLIDAENLRSYVESGEDTFNWKYTSVRIPSIDAIGSEGESDVYVTEFTFEEITTNGTTVNVSPELVNAIYNKRIIVIPGKSGNYIATNTFSNRPFTTVSLRMQIATGVYIYDVTLNAKGTAPQAAQTVVRVTNLLSGALNTINGIGLTKGDDMQLVSSISLNGQTYTPRYGAVDLGNIVGDGGNVSFIDNNSLQGLPFGYIGGYYRSYEFDGTSSAEVNLGYIDSYYIDTIVIAHNDVLYEESIRGLKGDGKILGTVVVRVDDSYNLYAKQLAPKKSTFGWRIYTDKQLMPDSWVDLENYCTKSYIERIEDKVTEVSNVLESKITYTPEVTGTLTDAFLSENGSITANPNGWGVRYHYIAHDCNIDYKAGKIGSIGAFVSQTIPSVGDTYKLIGWGDPTLLQGTIRVNAGSYFCATYNPLAPDNRVDIIATYVARENLPQRMTRAEERIDGKQDKLTLTVKDNGNIVIGGIAGQSKEFMPATPSGDPMHDVYLSYYGVTYDDATGLYSLGYLNNLTVEDMRKAFRTYGGGVMSIAYNSWVNSWALYNTIKGELPRTTLPSHTNGVRYFYDKIHFSFAWNALEQIYIGLRATDQYGMIKVWQYNTAETMFAFAGMENLKYIVDTLHCNYTHNLTIFATLAKLEEVRLYGLGGNVSFAAAKNLSLETVLYAINNCASGVSFTMALNSNVYNKCIESGEWYSEVKSALDGASTDKNTIITIASA